MFCHSLFTSTTLSIRPTVTEPHCKKCTFACLHSAGYIQRSMTPTRMQSRNMDTVFPSKNSSEINGCQQTPWQQAKLTLSVGVMKCETSGFHSGGCMKTIVTLPSYKLFMLFIWVNRSANWIPLQYLIINVNKKAWHAIQAQYVYRWLNFPYCARIGDISYANRTLLLHLL